MINSFILFTQRKQPFKSLNPLSFQAPPIIQFLVMMNEVILLWVVFGRFPMVILYEAYHLIVSYSPTFFLGHTSYV